MGGKKSFKAFCVENGLTARKIEEDCGISRSTIWSYFQGQRVPSRKNMKVLSEKYGINVYEFFM